MKIRIADLKNIVREEFNFTPDSQRKPGEAHWPHPVEDALDEWISGFSPLDVVEMELNNVGAAPDVTKRVLSLCRGMEKAQEHGKQWMVDSLAAELREFLRDEFRFTLDDDFEKPIEYYGDY